MKKFLCIFLCTLLLLMLVSGCGKNKVAKVLISEEIADSALVTQLTDAFTAQTGYKVDFIAQDRGNVERTLEKDDFDAALVITQNAADKLGSGEWIGGSVFFDTLCLIGPQNDPASARHLGEYAMRDILKHLTLTSFSFVHPSLVTPLGMKDVSLWLMVDATPDTEQFLLAQDAGQQMILLANEQGAYAITTREDWTRYGEEAGNLTVLLTGVAGITDQYTVLAKKIEEGKDPSAAQAFCQWMMGQDARNIIVNYREPDALTPVFESNIPAQ